MVLFSLVYNYLSIAGDHGVYHHSQEAATHRRPDFHDGWALSVVGPSDLLPEVIQHPCQDAAGELLQTAAVHHLTDQEGPHKIILVIMTYIFHPLQCLFSPIVAQQLHSTVVLLFLVAGQARPPAWNMVGVVHGKALD